MSEEAAAAEQKRVEERLWKSIHFTLHLALYGDGDGGGGGCPPCFAVESMFGRGEKPQEGDPSCLDYI